VKEGETTRRNPTGESPVRPKLASRPVASVAIHRATGGCEAYTARKQAVKIQLRNLSMIAYADAVRSAEGSIRVRPKLRRAARDRRSP
jgi:hypothetical protein